MPLLPFVRGGPTLTQKEIVAPEASQEAADFFRLAVSLFFNRLLDSQNESSGNTHPTYRSRKKSGMGIIAPLEAA